MEAIASRVEAISAKIVIGIPLLMPMMPLAFCV